MPAMVNSVKNSRETSPLPTSDNALKLPPLSCAQTYSENPYEVDLSFHSLNILAFKECQKIGRNQGYRPYAEWEKNYPFPGTETESSDASDTDSDDKKDQKLQDDIQRTTQLLFEETPDRGKVVKLKDPINLFPKELGPQQAARWPADIHVIHKQIKHIPYVPNEPEPFYKVTATEKMPMVRGEERGGRLVFVYEPRSTFFVRSRVGGIRTGPEQCAVSIDRSSDDTTLVFESRFESGNLAKAIQVGEYEYELWLRCDLYTSKNTQWFYFSMSNTRPNVVYRFSIVNFMKPDSLYNNGMKPLFYSEKEALAKKIGWRRCGLSIKYYRNNLKYETSKGEKTFYSLTWTCEFPHKNDTVYFSHCYPYTYTDLQDYLLELSNDPVKSKICKQRVLCRTLAGNLVYLLTITSPSANPEDIKHKKAVVLTSRVHPGESNASWMMKGFLDYLTGNSADSKLLRDTFIFKIVPMLNPDGVIVGNYRCSLAGRDLNRNYKTVLKDAYPTVWHTKQMIRRLLQEREIVAYCDLHGHSRRQNVFIYGCENRFNPERRLQERIFPCMLNKNSPDKFNFASCKFKIQKNKEGTGRVVMWNMGILNSYTMEATFCGSTLGKKKGFHFNTRDFEEMGYDFCDTLLDYCDPDTTKCTNVLYDLEENLKREIRFKLEQKGINVDNMDLLSEDLSAFDLESSDGGSDSSVSDGPPVHLQFQSQRVSKKRRKLKSKKERDKAREGTKDTNKRSGDKERCTTEETNHRKALSGHQTSHVKQDKNAYLEALTHAYMRKGILQNQQDQAPAHIQYTGSSGKPPSTMPFSLEGLCPHLEQAFAAQLMAQHLQNMTGVVGNSFVRVWKDYLQKNRAPSKLQQLSMDDTVRQTSASPSQGTQTERRHTRHILEVSEAQKRQQELQQQFQGKQIEKTFSKTKLDEKEKLGRGLSSRLRAQIPSATLVNYDVFKISQMNMEDGEAEYSVNNENAKGQDTVEEAAKKEILGHHKEHKHNGRKSRIGMHDTDEEDEYGSSKHAAPDYVQNPHRHRPPRVKSAKGSGQEINNAIQSIKDLRHSLAFASANTDHSSTADNYLKKLLKNELKQADEDLDQITSHLQINIDNKQKQCDEMLHKSSFRDTAKANTSNTNHSIPVSSDKDKERINSNNNPIKTGKTEHFVSAIDTYTIVKSPKSEKTIERKHYSNNGEIHHHSATSVNTNALENATVNNKLVDAYHIPHVNHVVSTKQDQLKVAKLPHDTDVSGHLKNLNKYRKLEAVPNGNSQLHYSSATDLSQPQFYPNATRTTESTKKNRNIGGNGTLLCSASSNSSKDESWSGDKVADREKNEVVTRVKSAKGNVRQVVETIPTRISLMITQDHEDTRLNGGQFLPMSRTIGGNLNKSTQQQSRRK